MEEISWLFFSCKAATGHVPKSDIWVPFTAQSPAIDQIGTTVSSLIPRLTHVRATCLEAVR